MSYPPQNENQQQFITNSDLSQNNSSNQQLNQQLITPNDVQTNKPGFQNVPQPILNMAPAPQLPIAQPIAYIQPVVASNQVIPNTIIIRNPQDFKISPIVCTCPNCRNTVTTIVSTNFNVLNCLCCFCTTLVCWIVFQCIRDKEISCDDATHICPHCQYVIFNYSAC